MNLEFIKCLASWIKIFDLFEKVINKYIFIGKLKNKLRKVEPKAFIIVWDVSEVMRSGIRDISKNVLYK